MPFNYLGENNLANEHFILPANLPPSLNKPDLRINESFRKVITQTLNSVFAGFPGSLYVSVCVVRVKAAT